MNWKFLIVFLLAFQIEVRVRANFADQPIGEPEKCWKSESGACSVQAGGRPLQLKGAQIELWAEGDSLLDREGDSWRVLKGAVRGQAEGEATLRFLFGQVTGSGEFWVIESGERFVVRAVREAAKITTRDGRTLEVPEGLEMWVGPLSLQGSQAHGLPELIPVEDHLKRWSALGDMKKEEFIEAAKKLRARWKIRQDVAAGLYEKVTERHLASIEDAKQEKLRKAAGEKAERERFRQLLHEKVFER